jgi:hypothetical protein
MQIRRATIKRKNKTYQYAQLVVSRRRKSDGMVMKHVVANLGQLDDQTFANIKLALEASRTGDRVAVVKLDQSPRSKPDQNLRYLDVAVLLQVWRRLGLDEVISRLIPQAGASVAPTDVLAALVLHRCLDPDSKLKATRWFPRTALPELLGVSPTALEYTRLHRLLEKLDQAGNDLMRELSSRYLEQDPAFSALLMDVTDAWFHGNGPDLAERARCKDGVIRKMIGILLVCNEHGYPLRWRVINGRYAETTAMIEQFRQLRYVRWAKDVPVVVDRALGNTVYLQQLLQTRLRFVVPLARCEIPNFVAPLPQIDCPTQGKRADLIRHLGNRAKVVGFRKINDLLYYQDQGVVEHDPGKRNRSCRPLTSQDRCQFALHCARSMRHAVEDGSAPSRQAAARAMGIGKGAAAKYDKLTKLTESLQMAVLEGEARGIALGKLIAVAGLPSDEQPAAFENLAAKAAVRPARPAPKNATSCSPSPEHNTVRVRAVAYFNPDLFLDQRHKAISKLRRVERSLGELNEQLASPRSRRTKDAAYAAADRILRQESLVEAYHISIQQRDVEGRSVLHVTLTLCPEEWARRRSLDGFIVLVTPPDSDTEPHQLIQVYRQRDHVENDFRVIKSIVRLQPIWHHNDDKVRAHVTLCMLALLLERALHRMLRDTISATIALDSLSDCRLNRYETPGAESAYVITRQDSLQSKILEKIDMNHLVDDRSMIEAIHPR